MKSQVSSGNFYSLLNGGKLYSLIQWTLKMCYWQCNAYNSYINWVWHSSDVKHGTGCYLDEAFQLVVLCQELCLFLLQGEDVVRCLLQDGRLMEKEKKMRIVHGQITWCSHKTVAKAEMKLKSIFFYVSVFAGCFFFLHLAEFLSVRVGQECFEGLETCVDALHAPAFVAVGNLSANSSLLVLGRLRTEGDVG